MKKVLVFGTFDIFHPGHKDFFSQARKYGDHLTVVIARDQTVKKVKGDYPVHNEDERLGKIKESPLVDEAVLGSLDDKYEVIREVRPAVICLGYDQQSFNIGLERELSKRNIMGIEIKKMKAYYPNIYKSSKLKDC